MIRVEHEAEAPVEVITRSQYETDLKVGYCILIYRPKGEQILRDRRNPGKEIRQPVDEVLTYRCMRCRFDCISGAYGHGEKQTTGINLIKAHIANGQHPWSYNPFENPYGNIADVVIEGIEDYSKEID